MWKYFFLKENINIRWWFCVLCSIYIVLFTYVLEPLKNESYHYNYPDYYNLLAIIGFFSISFLSCIFMPFQFPTFFEENSWTFTRFIIWFFLWFLSGSILAFSLDFFGYGFQFNSTNIVSYFFQFQVIVDLFTVIPIVFFFLSSYPSLNLKKAEKITIPTSVKQISSDSSILINSENVELDNSSNILSFTDTNGKNEFQITFAQLFYITSSDNYVDIFYKNGEGKLISKTMRNTLKTIDEQYTHLKGFFRCHKAFIINCQKVNGIKGNTKGYFLVLEDVIEKIPVSRNKNHELEQLFPHLL